MNHYASVTSKFLHNDYASAQKGAGAAGGLGFAFSQLFKMLRDSWNRSDS